MDDVEEIYFLRSDKTVLQFLDKEPAATFQEAGDFIKRITKDLDDNNGIMWGIALQEDPGKLIGSICYWRIQKEHYRAEIGYALQPAWWRKGIMKEAILEVLSYGFSTLQLHSIEARINPANIASAGILESTGFVCEANFKEDFYFRGKFGDTAVYSRLQ